MKTKEETKKGIVNYLTKTLKHAFIIPKKKIYRNGNYEYDYDDYTYFKVIKIDEDFYTLNFNKDVEDIRIRKIDIDYYIKYYNNNAKNLIKHSLFLDKKMKSIRNTKYIKERINNAMSVNKSVA